MEADLGPLVLIAEVVSDLEGEVVVVARVGGVCWLRVGGEVGLQRGGWGLVVWDSHAGGNELEWVVTVACYIWLL